MEKSPRRKKEKGPSPHDVEDICIAGSDLPRTEIDPGTPENTNVNSGLAAEVIFKPPIPLPPPVEEKIKEKIPATEEATVNEVDKHPLIMSLAQLWENWAKLEEQRSLMKIRKNLTQEEKKQLVKLNITAPMKLAEITNAANRLAIPLHRIPSVAELNARAVRRAEEAILKSKAEIEAQASQNLLKQNSTKEIAKNNNIQNLPEPTSSKYKVAKRTRKGAPGQLNVLGEDGFTTVISRSSRLNTPCSSSPESDSEEMPALKSSKTSLTDVTKTANKFSGLTVSDQLDDNMDVGNVENASNDPPTVTRPPKIPPIWLKPGSQWQLQLSLMRQSCAPSLQSKLVGNQLKLQVSEESQFRALTHYLKDTGCEFRSYNLKSERPKKIVIRGLPVHTSRDLIKSHVEAMDFTVLKIHQLTKRSSKKPMPLFYLQIDPSKFNEEIYAITQLLGTEVKIEPYKGRNGPSQCYRCQGFFHSSDVCTLPVRCVRCSKPHSAKDCNSEETLKCANCNGNHAASWKLCPHFPGNKKIAGAKNRTFKSAPPPKADAQNFPATLAKKNQLKQSTARTDTISYANIVSGEIPAVPLAPSTGESGSQNSKSSAPSGAQSDGSFAEVLTAVMGLAKELKLPLLLQAFRNALPALRVAPTGIDRAFAIFEAYCALHAVV